MYCLDYWVHLISRLDYCQYLLVSQINYTLTNFADHCERLSHDAVNPVSYTHLTLPTTPYV